MKIAGIVAINRFPLYRMILPELTRHCDKVFFRFDSTNGDPEIARTLPEIVGVEKVGGVLMAEGWRPPDWREECLRMVDEYQPDMVLCPDEDEVFGDTLDDELTAFYVSDKQGMMFRYDPLMTDDGRIIHQALPYPSEPHMKAFKWRSGLSYFPYHGQAKISAYFRPETHWSAQTRIRHYCAYTEGLEKVKQWRGGTPHGGRKAVTIIGFGPSAMNLKIPINSEVWTCNNAYDGFDAEIMRQCTRIFEMHQPEKRETLRAKDGVLHLKKLDQLARQGRRIIMLRAIPEVAHSEPYPLDHIIQRHGLDWFMGTPCYMLAMAIDEGYNEIWCWGLDQMDPEHVLQRECWGCWVGYALGRGIRMAGRFPFLERHQGRRYGYDWGPEYPAWAETLAWDAYPFQIHMKEDSRVPDRQLREFAEGKHSGRQNHFPWNWR